jgi:hypothetical protein
MFVSMTTLADYETVGNRSYGNELFQYAALKIYAEKYHLKVEIPERWIGRELFEGCKDFPVSGLGRAQKDFGSSQECIWSNGELLEDCNIKGYFQYHTSVYAPHKTFFRELFTPIQALRDRVSKTFDKLTGPLIGIHIRRGDYSRPPNRVAPNEWYLDWLEKNWDRFNNPTLFLASDDPEAVFPDFEKYKPMMLKPNTELLSMFLDHYILQHCDVLLASNSTFSFTAAMLSEKEQKCWRPDYQKKLLVEFDPWDADPISPFPHHEKEAVRLHLGCGTQYLPGYVNIDCKKTPVTDKICDIRQLPYQDNTVDTIECYHVLEHIPVCLHAAVNPDYGMKYASLIAVLEEWRRVLKPEGNLVIEMPDLDAVMREYLEADESRKEELLISIYGSYRNDDDTDIHRWGASEDRLRYILDRAGFKYIKFTEATDYHAKDTPCLRVEAIK